MMDERTVEINGVIYNLPENIKWAKDDQGYNKLVNEYGQKVDTNYAPPNRGYLEVPDIGRIKKHMYLTPVEGQDIKASTVKPGLAWAMGVKLIGLLFVNGSLADNYKDGMAEIEKQLEENGDEELRDYVLSRINAVINKFKKEKVIDFTLLGRASALDQVTTVKGYAERVGKSVRTVQRMCEAGKLNAKLEHGIWLIEVDQIDG